MTEDLNPSGPTQAELTELEIAAFMGPHISRARIALVLVGALYALTAFLHYADIAKVHDALRAYDGDSPQAARLKHLVDMAYYYVVFTGVAGVANMALAAIAGARPTFAMYAAMAIFAAHTLFQISIDVPFFVDWVWWIMAIVVGMGFHAAWKAEKLRRERAAPQARVVSL
jgi:hypothetical protein